MTEDDKWSARVQLLSTVWRVVSCGVASLWSRVAWRGGPRALYKYGRRVSAHKSTRSDVCAADPRWHSPPGLAGDQAAALAAPPPAEATAPTSLTFGASNEQYKCAIWSRRPR